MDKGLVAVLLCTIAAASTGAVNAAAAPGCALVPLGSIDLKIDDGRLYVSVTIDNVNALMTLNLSDAFSSIDQAAAEKFGLPLGLIPRGSIVRLGKAVITNYAVVSGLASGAVRFGTVKFLVVPESSAQHRDIKPNTIIGRMGFDMLARLIMSSIWPTGR